MRGGRRRGKWLEDDGEWKMKNKQVTPQWPLHQTEWRIHNSWIKVPLACSLWTVIQRSSVGDGRRKKMKCRLHRTREHRAMRWREPLVQLIGVSKSWIDQVQWYHSTVMFCVSKRRMEQEEEENLTIAGGNFSLKLLLYTWICVTSMTYGWREGERENISRIE